MYRRSHVFNMNIRFLKFVFMAAFSNSISDHFLTKQKRDSLRYAQVYRWTLLFQMNIRFLCSFLCMHLEIHGWQTPNETEEKFERENIRKPSIYTKMSKRTYVLNMNIRFFFMFISMDAFRNSCLTTSERNRREIRTRRY